MVSLVPVLPASRGALANLMQLYVHDWNELLRHTIARFTGGRHPEIRWADERWTGIVHRFSTGGDGHGAVDNHGLGGAGGIGRPAPG